MREQETSFVSSEYLLASFPFVSSSLGDLS